MAVKIRYLSVVVPIASIDRSGEPGGFKGLLERDSEGRGKSFWHDDALFVEYGMHPDDIQMLVERWEALGLTSRIEVNGQRKWKDLCVVDYYEGPTLACDWLDYDTATHVAWKKGTTQENPAGPDHDGDPEPVFVPNDRAAQMASFITAPREKAPVEARPWWKFW